MYYSEARGPQVDEPILSLITDRRLTDVRQQKGEGEGGRGFGRFWPRCVHRNCEWCSSNLSLPDAVVVVVFYLMSISSYRSYSGVTVRALFYHTVSRFSRHGSICSLVLIPSNLSKVKSSIVRGSHVDALPVPPGASHRPSGPPPSWPSDSKVLYKRY
jgi:hypothetical protein